MFLLDFFVVKVVFIVMVVFFIVILAWILLVVFIKKKGKVDNVNVFFEEEIEKDLVEMV